MVQFIRSSLSYFRPYWKSVSIVVAALLIQTAFKVGLPLGYSEIFDGAIAHTDLSYLKLLFCLLLVAWLLNLVAGLVQDRCTGRTGANVLTELRLRLFERLKGLPAANQSKRKSGDLLSLFSNDLAAIEVVYLKSAYTALYSSIVLVLSVGLLFVIEWRLALLTFISLPIALIGPRIIGAKAHRQNFDRKEYEALLTSELAENVGAVTEIRVFGLQANRLAHFRSHLSELKQRIQQAFVTAALVGRTSSQTVQVVQIVIMAVGGYLAIRGDLTVGSLVGFAALLMNVSNAANHLSAVIPEILPASAAFQRINVFLKANDCPNAPAGGQEFPKFSTIHFDDVSLSYDASETFSLREATFQVQSGQNVAIVGASGSGKSSILNLLLRLQSPTSGQIRFDAIDLESISEVSLRRRTSVVMQNTLLFNTSFRDNISMGLKEFSQDAIERAAKQAQIHDFICSLPEGYDTQVGEWGSNLSGGQRQRIAIARAMLRNPDLLILDEATSALDAHTEHAINQTLSSYALGRTTITTTHRLNSIKDADTILVMHAGRVTQQGTHEALLAEPGPYSTLWEKQNGFLIQADGAIEITTDRLAALPLLSGLSEARLRTIQQSGAFISESFNAGQTLFAQGDKGSKFYLIVRGKVEVSWRDSDRKSTQTLTDGDYFGEIALLDDQPRTATVTAIADSQMLSLSRREFRNLLDDEPDLRKSIEAEVRSRIAEHTSIQN